MQPKDQRTPVSDPNTVLSDDPNQVLVTGPDGLPISWESRQGFGELRQKLNAPKRKDFIRYWFNDEPERIGDALKAGYTHVLDKNGEPVFRIVDKGTGMRGYLMEIPEVWYNADLAKVQKRTDEVMQQIKSGNAPSPEGQAAGITGRQYYGGIRVTQRRDG